MKELDAVLKAIEKTKIPEKIRILRFDEDEADKKTTNDIIKALIVLEFETNSEFEALFLDFAFELALNKLIETIPEREPSIHCVIEFVGEALESLIKKGDK